MEFLYPTPLSSLESIRGLRDIRIGLEHFLATQVNPVKNEVNTEIEIMRISSTGAIEGGRVLQTIGQIEAASTWHPARSSPLQQNWRELILRELIRKAEDIDADAIIRVDYHNDGVIRIDETGVKLKRVVATGIAVKLSRAA
jgi:hypothetical protein